MKDLQQQLEQAYEKAFITGDELDGLTFEEILARSAEQLEIATQAEAFGIDLSDLYARLDPGARS